MVADFVTSRGGGRDPAVVRAAPGRGVVDLGLGVNESAGLRKVFGQEGYDVACRLEFKRTREADDASAVSGC